MGTVGVGVVKGTARTEVGSEVPRLVRDGAPEEGRLSDVESDDPGHGKSVYPFALLPIIIPPVDRRRRKGIRGSLLRNHSI